jgi:regulatory protein
MPELTSTPDTSVEASADESFDPADIRLAAMNLLARREHSRFELGNKLSRRFTDVAMVNDQLFQLAREGLQSDVRFAESYARQRVSRGYGLVRLREEMRERGVSEDDFAVAMEELAVDWRAVAAEVLRKKFGAQDAIDFKENARRSRFMQYRGFTAEHYRRLQDD